MRRRGRRAVLFGIVALVILGLIAWTHWLHSAMSRAADPASTTASAFLVNKGETAADIASRLEARGFIRSGFAFTWAASSRKLENQFHVGTYRISPSMSGDEILTTLTNASADIRVTFPEGFTVRDIAQRLSDAGIADASSVRDCAKTCSFDLPILASKPQGVDLEGYLFPDTYEFTTGAPAQEIVGTMVRTLDRRIDADLRARITASGHSLHEVLTMASLIEKEVAAPRDRRIVAGILWKRLERGIPLGVDASLLYALGEHRGAITADELRTDSPYNTRLHKGLPPGPISNPGLDAIRAAVNPEASEWLFYLTDDQGAAHYARTNAEHEANKELYLR